MKTKCKHSALIGETATGGTAICSNCRKRVRYMPGQKMTMIRDYWSRQSKKACVHEIALLLETQEKQNEMLKEKNKDYNAGFLKGQAEGINIGKEMEDNYSFEKGYKRGMGDKAKLSQEVLANARIELILFCPLCKGRHIDRGLFESKPHHTHACQHCGHCWRPSVFNTIGVHFLPGFKDKEGA